MHKNLREYIDWTAEFWVVFPSVLAITISFRVIDVLGLVINSVLRNDQMIPCIIGRLTGR